MPVRTLEEIAARANRQCAGLPDDVDATGDVLIRQGELREIILAALREAVARRDMEWWEAVVLVDSVAPEPEAAKRWIVTSQDYHIKHAVAQERAALREVVADVRNTAWRNISDTDTEAICDEITKRLDAREKSK